MYNWDIISTWILPEERFFDCSKEIYHEVWSNHYEIHVWLVSMGYDLMNQTACVWNFLYYLHSGLKGLRVFLGCQFN
jgi:hypothetical protein